MFCASCNHFLEWPDSPRAHPQPPAQAQPRVVAAQPAAQAQPSADNRAEVTIPAPLPEPGLIAETVAGVAKGRQLASARSREDLVAQLDEVHTRLTERTVQVVVVGEFKRGKSTLVNALLQTAVCPVDADVVTAVPTFVRYGVAPGATAYFEPGEPDSAPGTEPVALDAIHEFVSESGNPGNRRRLRSVEIRLKHRMLRSGLCLIDTPGVGGLDSAHGVITLSALDLAQGILFVTDASQEFTEPEISFLKEALGRCSVAACVVTKTDLYPEWRRIVELDKGHLARAGLEIPVIPVSSFLRLRARRDPALTPESGFPPLIEFLAVDVVKRADAAAAQAAAQDIGFVTEQVGHELAAEQAVVTEPGKAKEVVTGLAAARDRSASLASSTATWQQVLADGVQDLVATIEHDLQERLRAVLRDVESVVDEGDPKNAWTDIEVWLRRQVAAAAVANYDLLARRAEEVASTVAERFDLDAGTRTSLAAGGPADALNAVIFASPDTAPTGGQFTSMLMATRVSAFIPAALFGLAGSLPALVLGPLSLVLAVGIGGKIMRDERKRQLAHRRQQAKLAARRYVDEVGFIMSKEARDALRRTQRQLRDDFQRRAVAIHSSSVRALAAAEQATRLAPAQRQLRASELAAESAQLQAVGSRLRTLTAAGGARG